MDPNLLANGPRLVDANTAKGTKINRGNYIHSSEYTHLQENTHSAETHAFTISPPSYTTIASPNTNDSQDKKNV